MNTKDHRQPVAIARDEWQESEEWKSLSAGTTSGEYLENRLVKAFFAGWAAKEKADRLRTARGTAK